LFEKRRTARAISTSGSLSTAAISRASASAVTRVGSGSVIPTPRASARKVIAAL
jgi:hypothetical protein